MKIVGGDSKRRFLLRDTTTHTTSGIYILIHIPNLSNNYHLLIQLQNLLASHDIVAQRDYQPKLSEIPVEVDEDEETIKIVQLVKSQDALVNIYLAVEFV